MTIYLSGSFTVLHPGHYEMFDRACDICRIRYWDNIRIGIMSDDYIKKKYPNKELPDYYDRRDNVKEYIINELQEDDSFDEFLIEFFEQNDPEYMPEMKYDDVLIVSKETLPHALKLLEGYVIWPMLSVVPMRVDEHGEEYHSRKILEKEDD